MAASRKTTRKRKPISSAPAPARKKPVRKPASRGRPVPTEPPRTKAVPPPFVQPTQCIGLPLPNDVLDELRTVCEARDIRPADFVRMAIRVALQRIPREYSVGTVLNFGQYRNETLGNVIKINPGYVEWCMGKSIFVLDATALDALDKATVRAQPRPATEEATTFDWGE